MAIARRLDLPPSSWLWRQQPKLSCLLAWCALAFISTASADNLFSFESPMTQIRRGSEGLMVNLPFNVTLFNRRLTTKDTLWISEHGYISIGSDYRLIGEQEKVRFPISSPSSNPTLIMAFYARVRYYPTNDEDQLAKVQYTWLDKEQDLDVASESIRRNAASASHFNARKGLAVTWEKMGPEDPRDIGWPTKNNRNTFQMTIVTDDHYTFVIFNYEAITWGSNQTYVQAGFNLGGEKAMYNVPHSGPVDTLDDGQASDVKGRYIFTVADLMVQPVSCFPDGAYPLLLSRSYGTPFGGDTIWVSGPCFSDDLRNVQCKFGDKVVEAKRESASIVSCTPPMQYRLGRLPFRLLLDNRLTDSYAFYTLVLNGRMAPGVRLANEKEWYNATSDQRLTIQWNSADFPQGTQSVHIKIYTYEEKGDQASMNEYQTMSTNAPNSGEFTFRSGDVTCGEACASVHELGAIAVQSMGAYGTTLWTDYMPMGWFVGPPSARSEWAAGQCRNFWQKDSTDRSWTDELLPCPCSLDQAMADFGRFQADVGCDIATGSMCTYHVGAKHCVRSVHATPKGAGNQCCYNAKGELMYAGDSDYGSTPDRSHTWGAPPYVKAGLVPDASHWLVDVVTFYYCCWWAQDSCQIYMDLRPTKDCKEYQPPKAAAIFGDPHLVTFDGVSYTFNGKGDFVLMDVSVDAERFRLHGRFAQPDPRVNATVLRRVATKDSNSDVIEVEANGDDSSEPMTVYVNYVPVSFAIPELQWQEFEGPTYVSYDGRGTPSYTIIHRSGTGVKVSFAGNSLTVFVMAPPRFKGRMSHALLGTWDNNRNNELAEGSNMESRDDIEHYGNLKKLLDETASLFRYTQAATLGYYNDVRSYRADTSDKVASGNEASSLCGNVQQCLFDLAVSGDAVIAKSSLRAWELVGNLTNMLKTVVSCGMPVQHGKRSGNSYVEGSTVTVVGCIDGYQLQDPTTEKSQHRCTPEGKWYPEVTAVCKFVGWPALRQQVEQAEDHTLIIALAVSIPIIIIVAAIVVTLYCVKRKRGLKSNSKQIRQTKNDANSTENQLPDATPRYAFDSSSSARQKASPGHGQPPAADFTGRSYRSAVGEQVPV